jgi:Predicted membrane protein
MAALFTGQEWWLGALLVGYVAVVPIVALLFGDRAEVAEYWDQRPTASGTTDDDSRSESTSDESTADALESLRERYARGELTDEQFEAKLDRLLETETVEDATDYRRQASEERDRELERE